MKVLGTLKPKDQNHMFNELEGYIRTFMFEGLIQVAVTDKPPKTGKSPTHVVKLVLPSGERSDIGDAWLRTVRQGDNQGNFYLSVIIDDPAFEQALKFAIFERGDHAVAQWKRQPISFGI
jgi:uncharacterized protein (DUF736 family)